MKIIKNKKVLSMALSAMMFISACGGHSRMSEKRAGALTPLLLCVGVVGVVGLCGLVEYSNKKQKSLLNKVKGLIKVINDNKSKIFIKRNDEKGINERITYKSKSKSNKSTINIVYEETYFKLDNQNLEITLNENKKITESFYKVLKKIETRLSQDNLFCDEINDLDNLFEDIKKNFGLAIL